ncbi:hypothetical protein Purlil1_2373 [Purpureocillium lilacinum]|uniref:Uncharacterized protein n=1 Tax=Purpureocillium lilacinum TaxID=33203 RepID=A0ABR0CAX2_PURLI|nr:hypothetical protein Purlil1_2373 [Purpureocillium lilacinum]
MRRANCSSASDRGTSKGFLLANGKTHSLPSNETPYQEPHDWLDAFELAALSQLNAHSAASSLALLRFLPSYQYLASTVLPWTMTLLDHAWATAPSGHNECHTPAIRNELEDGWE